MSFILSNILKNIGSYDLCAICRCILDVSFPKDFPSEWKFCCGCLEWAKLVVNPKKLEIKILRRIPGFIRAEKKITLVG